MVTFWIVAGVLTLGIAALILKPLLRKTASRSVEVNPDIAIYRSQLKELERDAAAGAIGEDEVRTARAEISRRLLAANDEAMMSSSGVSSRQRIAIALLVCLVTPALATLVYLQKGSPDYAATPYTDHNGEAQLWAQYGMAYMNAEQFGEAVEAFQQAIELSDPDAGLYEMLGEAIVMANDRVISGRAIAAFRKALELDPQRERSRYIIAEDTYRGGDRETGVRAFIDLLEETRDPGLQAFLKERIESAITEIKAELSGDPAAARPEFEAPSRPLSGVSEAQSAQINQMVEQLAARLKTEPDNIEGWLRLIRSYTVLQEMEKAREALQTATLIFLTRREDLNRILTLTEELGLTSGPELPEGVKDIEVP